MSTERPDPRDLEEWPGWRNSVGRDGSRARRLISAEKQDPNGFHRLGISWGRAEEHGVYGPAGRERYGDAAGSWGPGVRWFVDLEYFNASWPSDPLTQTACHIERGLTSEAQMWAWVAWLRSCVEVCGEEGLRALNARTGGRLA